MKPSLCICSAGASRFFLLSCGWGVMSAVSLIDLRPAVGVAFFDVVSSKKAPNMHIAHAREASLRNVLV
jgi:hypothetical protein